MSGLPVAFTIPETIVVITVCVGCTVIGVVAGTLVGFLLDLMEDNLGATTLTKFFAMAGGLAGLVVGTLLMGAP